MIKKALKVERIATDQPQKGAGVLSYIASTSAEDRYGDIVSQNWDLDNYRANPIVLLNHNSQELPIGKGDVSVVDGQLLIDITFDMEDPKAAEVARKAEAGFLNAVSVGFNPQNMISREELPEDHYASGTRGNFYESAELLEVSMVTIPANGEATSLAAKGISLAEYGLPNLEIIRCIVDSRIRKHQTDMAIFKHITEVQELEDRFVVTYMKAAEEEAEEEAEEAEEEAAEEEGWKEDLEEEEEKIKGLLPEEIEILKYLIKIGA